MATWSRCFARCVMLPRAQEALYPLAAKLPPVSEFFVDPALREDAGLLARLAAPAKREHRNLHDHNEPGSRGGFSLYVPEYYTPDRAWPLVMALHGGSGNGRGFLWSWLRDARSHGAILVAPTATGSTWALMGEDTDTPNLARILDLVRAPLEHRFRQTAADRDERRRHLLLCHRAGERLPLHPPCAGRRHLPSADGRDGRCREIARLADLSRAWPARLDVPGAGGAADASSCCRRPAPR